MTGLTRNAMKLVFGGLSTTRHQSQIGMDKAQGSTNVTVKEGILMLGPRYRQWQAMFGSNTISGFGTLSNFKADKVLVVRDGVIRSIDARMANSSVSEWSGAFDGTSTAFWSNPGTPTNLLASTSVWHIVQFGGAAIIYDSNSALYTGRTAGNVYYIDNINESRMRVKKLFQFYGGAPPSVITKNKPPYTFKAFSATDAFAQLSNVTWNYTSARYDSTNGAIVVHYDSLHNSYLDYQGIEIEYDTADDWSQVDHIAISIRTTRPDLPTWIDTTNPTFSFIDDAGAGTTYTHVITSEKIKSFIYVSQNAMFIDMWIDISGVTKTQRAAVLKIRPRWVIDRSGEVDVWIYPVSKGGVYHMSSAPASSMQSLKDPSSAALAEDLVYAYSYIDTVGANGETSATEISVAAAIWTGQRAAYSPDATSQSFMGSSLKLTIPTFATGTYDSINIYREVRDWSNGSGETKRWQRLTRIANSGTPTYDDVLRDGEVSADTTTYPVATPTIGTIEAAGTGQVSGVTCVAVWRGAAAYFHQDGAVYYSRVGNFKEVIWGGDYAIPVSLDDYARPRTVSVSEERGEPVIAAVATRALYMFTKRSAYAHSAQWPSDPQFAPRKIPDAPGALGPLAACEYQGGAIVASQTGLWAVEVANLYSGDSGQSQVVNLTIDVQDTWNTLIGSTESDWQYVTVAVHKKEIWVACRTRVMRLTEFGEWEYHVMTDQIKFLKGDSRWGLIGVGVNSVSAPTTGKMVNFGAYQTDAGTNSAGSNGTTVSLGTELSVNYAWEYTTKRFVATSQVLRAEIYSNSEADMSPGILVRCSTSRKVSPASVKQLGNVRVPFSHAAKTSTGIWSEFTLRGTPTAECYEVSIEYSGTTAGSKAE